MKIEYGDVLNMKYYEYGQPFTGSLGEMCYRIERNPLEDVHFTPPAKREPSTLKAIVWKGPFNYVTTEEEKIEKEFDFSNEGKNELVDWLNAIHDEKYK